MLKLYLASKKHRSNVRIGTRRWSDVVKLLQTTTTSLEHPVPFDGNIREIESIDDSLETEVQRDASGVIFKNSPESPILVSSNAKTTEKTESQSENADVKPRAGTPRLQHMQLFFSEVRAINEEKESQRSARHAEKENRRAERKAERQALLEERRKMHDEKMEILRQAFGLQK